MANKCRCGVAPTSFQCAARGLPAARATRRARCRDRGCILKERSAAGVTPSRQRCERRASAGLGTAACQHHWRVRPPGSNSTFYCLVSCLLRQLESTATQGVQAIRRSSVIELFDPTHNPTRSNDLSFQKFANLSLRWVPDV